MLTFFIIQGLHGSFRKQGTLMQYHKQQDPDYKDPQIRYSYFRKLPYRDYTTPKRLKDTYSTTRSSGLRVQANLGIWARFRAQALGSLGFGAKTKTTRKGSFRGTFFGGPYNKDPTIQGTILGSSIFGNSHIGVQGLRGLEMTSGSRDPRSSSRLVACC